MSEKRGSNTKRHLSVRLRLIYTSIGFVLLLCILSFMVYHFYQTLADTDAKKEAIKELSSIYHETLAYEKSLFNEDLVSASFYEEKSSVNLSKIEENKNKTFAILSDLEQCHYCISIDNYQAYLDSLELFDSLYFATLSEMVELVKKRGFKDYGIVGQMRSAIHLVSDNYMVADNHALMAQVLTLRKHEKDYIIRKDPAYVQAFSYAYEDLLANLPLLLEDPFLSLEIAENLQNYSSYFQQLVNIENQIGLHNNSGLQNDLLSHHNAFLQHTNHLVSEIEEFNKLRINLVGLAAFGLLLVASFILVFSLLRLSKRIVVPLNLIKRYLGSMSKGEIPEKIERINGNSEFTDIIDLLNIRIVGLRKTEQFAREIKAGNYDADFNVLSDQDTLGKALLEMRDTLKQNEIENQARAKSEREQSWINNGTARMAEILNQNYKNAADFAYSVINYLVKYLDANQGGLFLLNDDDPQHHFLELKGMVAYDRRKYANKQFEFGEGFIGTCVLERKPIYRTEIPRDYISVTSGLGGANPRVLLILPLLVDEEIYGALEIASFHEMDEYKRDFVRKVSESIATTISGIKSKERTEKLLLQTQEQSEKISQTEEEMRQNMEELQATQEEMQRKQSELMENQTMLENIIDLVPFPVFVKNKERKYIIVNQEQALLFGRSKHEILEFKDEDLIKDTHELALINESDDKVIEENRKLTLPAQQITLGDGSVKILQTIKVPFCNNKTQNINILGVSIDLSDKVKGKEDLENANKTISKLKKKLEQNSDGA